MKFIEDVILHSLEGRWWFFGWRLIIGMVGISWTVVLMFLVTMTVVTFLFAHFNVTETIVAFVIFALRRAFTERSRFLVNTAT